jgi:hypothetical protein
LVVVVVVVVFFAVVSVFIADESCFIVLSFIIAVSVVVAAGAGAGAIMAAESVVSVFVSFVVQAAMLRTAATRARRFMNSPWGGGVWAT